jgi:hypothetical protein
MTSLRLPRHPLTYLADTGGNVMGHNAQEHEAQVAGPVFRTATERDEEIRRQRSLVEQITRAAIQQGHVQPSRLLEPQSIPHTALPAGSPGSPIACEWDVYRREVGRLLEEGNESRWVLIKGDQIIGIWESETDAQAVALQKYLMQPCLIQQVRSREPLVRMSARYWGCQR